jgi:hypothetical protein
MQELSRSIDHKNLHEQYLLRKNNEDDRQTNYDSRAQPNPTPSSPPSPQDEIVPTHISASVLRRNEELHRRLKELQVRE